MTTASTLSRQLRLNVHPADGALLIGNEPLVHTQLVEEVHTRKSSGEETSETLSHFLHCMDCFGFFWYKFENTC